MLYMQVEKKIRACTTSLKININWNSDTDDRCRIGCHDIALQNMQIVFDSVYSLSK